MKKGTRLREGRDPCLKGKKDTHLRVKRSWAQRENLPQYLKIHDNRRARMEAEVGLKNFLQVRHNHWSCKLS